MVSRLGWRANYHLHAETMHAYTLSPTQMTTTKSGLFNLQTPRDCPPQTPPSGVHLISTERNHKVPKKWKPICTSLPICNETVRSRCRCSVAPVRHWTGLDNDWCLLLIERILLHHHHHYHHHHHHHSPPLIPTNWRTTKKKRTVLWCSVIYMKVKSFGTDSVTIEFRKKILHLILWS